MQSVVEQFERLSLKASTTLRREWCPRVLGLPAVSEPYWGCAFIPRNERKEGCKVEILHEAEAGEYKDMGICNRRSKQCMMLMEAARHPHVQ